MAPILITHYAVHVPSQENLASNVAGTVLHERTESSNLVRFPNSLCCELGERSVKNRGIEVLRSIVAKIYIESG